MASGIKVNNKVTSLFLSMKIPSSTEPRIRVAVLKINEEKGEIVLDKVVRDPDIRDQDPFEFVKSCLEPLNCRYIIYDCHFKKEGSTKEELVYILWCDEEAKMRSKMQYAASNRNLRKVAVGIKHQFQVNCCADISCRKEFAKMLGEGVTSVEGVSL